MIHVMTTNKNSSNVLNELFGDQKVIECLNVKKLAKSSSFSIFFLFYRRTKKNAAYEY